MATTRQVLGERGEQADFLLHILVRVLHSVP